MSKKTIEKVVIHPTVLLSVVDHYSRTGSLENRKRVVGILLGTHTSDGVVEVTTSFAAVYDEEQTPEFWFLSGDYVEEMAAMLKKVNAKEKIVGWYHTGPKLCSNDVEINQKMTRFCTQPVLVVIDPQYLESSHPTEAYLSVSEVHDDGTPVSTTFEHIPSESGAEAVEEAGVEHLLRDIHKYSPGTVDEGIAQQLMGLRGLYNQLEIIRGYLDEVQKDILPVNHQINYQLQEILQLLPDLTSQLIQSTLNINMSHDLLTIFIASAVRAVLAQHKLINNKLSLAHADNQLTRQEKPI